ncbi:MAG: hypothetical protein Q9163_001273 [Psora crenata]
MGQRHQLFVIARTNQKYRTLAAVHHQWLYGHTALRRCLGTLEILQGKNNRVPLEEELKDASRRSEGFWGALQDHGRWSNTTDVHFPFIMTCLILGASFGVHDGYFHDIIIEPFQMAYDEGDNNNGITIFDISEPSDVRYCFVDFHGMESDRSQPVQLMTPLSAQTYLAAYYELDDPKFTELIQQFKDRTLIDVNALADTWPHGDWQESEIETGSNSHTALDVAEFRVSETSNPTSLRAQSLDQLVQSVVNGEEIDPEVLSSAISLRDFHVSVRDKLYKEAENLEPFPDMLDLLFDHLKDDQYVNLSLFTTLSTVELFSLAVRLARAGSVKCLNLSGCDLRDQDLHALLSHEGLQKVYMMGDNAVLLAQLAASKPKVDLYHHALLKRPLVEDLLVQDGRETRGPTPPMLDFSPCENAVVQLIWVRVSQYVFLNSECFGPNGDIVWENLRHDTKVPRQSCFSNEAEPRYHKFPLMDVPMSPTRLITGLSSVLQWMSKSSIRGPWELSKGIASSFALSAPSSDTMSCGVGPFSTELSLNNGTNDISAQSLKPGQWAVVLIHEFFDALSQDWIDELIKPKAKGGRSERTLKKQLKYVMITPTADSTNRFTIADVPTFLKTATDRTLGDQLSQWWGKQDKVHEEVQFYDREDIHTVLSKVYPSATASNDEENDGGE